MFSGDTIYFRFEASSIYALNANNGRFIDDHPVMLISDNGKSRKVIRIGNSVKIGTEDVPGNLTNINPFQHPRVIISNFTIAEKMFILLVKELVSGRIFRPKPTIVFHPKRDLDGGITSLEVKMLKDIGLFIGGIKVFVWLGRNLTQPELLNKSFLNEPHDYELCGEQ